WRILNCPFRMSRPMNGSCGRMAQSGITCAMQRDPTALRSERLFQAGFRNGFSLAPLDFRGMRIGECARTLAAELGFDALALYQASQVHGARVVVAEGDPADMLREEADALVAFTA